jgi:hypothetical protein
VATAVDKAAAPAAPPQSGHAATQTGSAKPGAGDGDPADTATEDQDAPAPAPSRRPPGPASEGERPAPPRGDPPIHHAAAVVGADAVRLPSDGRGVASPALAVAPPPPPPPSDGSASPATGGVPLSAFASTIVAHARLGSSSFDVRLDPPDLGRVDIRLDIGQDGRVSSHMIVERRDTLDLLRADQRGLERTLEQAGLRTDAGSLSFSLRDDRGAQQGWSQPRPEPARPPPSPTPVPSPDVARAGAEIAYGRAARPMGGVDIRV